jgi:RsiW-degrading membrane proteinase PrsW (M82 family)
MTRVGRPLLVSAAVAACLLAVLLAWRLSGTPILILFAAVVPALCYGLAIVRIERFEREPRVLLLVMFLWGAGAAAVLATAANDAVEVWLGGWQNPDIARSLTARLAAPVIEELAKAVALSVLLLRGARLNGVLDGIVYGALIGIGFAMTENATYFILAAVQGGEAGLLQSVYLRAGLGGLNHAAFTATVGAALGWFVQHRGHWRWLAPPLGLALAIAEHVLWNALAAGAIDTLVCNPATPGGACRPPAPAAALFVRVPIVVAVCLGPALIVLAVVARLARRQREAAGRPASR